MLQLILALVVVLVCTLCAFAWWGFWRCWSARQWAVVTGTVLDAFVRESDPDEFHVRYEYVVRKKRHTASRMDPASRFVNVWTSERERRLQDFARGCKVAVYYDPGDPADSALGRGNWPNWLGAALVASLPPAWIALTLTLSYPKWV